MKLIAKNKNIIVSQAIGLLVLPVIASAQIEYQLESFIEPDSIQGLLVSILNVFVILATPIIILFIIYAGFQYVTARGNAEQIQKATTALTYAIIGAVLIIGAVAISEIVKSVVDAFAA